MTFVIQGIIAKQMPMAVNEPIDDVRLVDARPVERLMRWKMCAQSDQQHNELLSQLMTLDIMKLPNAPLNCFLMKHN
jgi:hypothetical protein